MPTNRKTGPDAIPDREDRDLIVSELDRNILIEASAGTGKTTSIVARMLAVLRTGTCPDIGKMAAVTFTRKAAAELRARFHIELERALGEAGGEERARLQRALQQLEEAFIGTIHSFCGRLLRERPVEAGIDLAFEEIEDEDDARLREEAWDAFANLVTAEDADGLLARLHELGLSLNDIRASFFDFADFPDVDYWPVPDVSMADLHLGDAREELVDYVKYVAQLAPLLPVDAGSDTLIPRLQSLPRVISHYDLDLPDQLMEALALFDREAKITQKVWKESGLTGSEAKREKGRWDSFREETALPALHAWREMRYAVVMRLLHRARDIYDERRRQLGVLNFQDLLIKAAALLRDNPDVRRYFQSRFTHIFVDEFQDTDPVQAEVIILLVSSEVGEREWRRAIPRPGSLFVVGDPKQSIYRFRRADITTYNEVKRIIERNGGRVVRLQANFRAHPDLLDWVNSVFEPAGATAPHQAGERFPEKECEESPSYVRLLPGRPHSRRHPAGVLRLEVPESLTRQEEVIPYEADVIAGSLRAILDEKIEAPSAARPGEPSSPQWRPCDFMIITRNTARLAAYARALQDYGIPCQVAGGAGLSEIGELRLLVLCLRCITRPHDPVDLAAALRSELFGVSDDILYSFKKAGGVFSFHTDVPEELDESAYAILDDAFRRLRSYYLWLSRLPVVPALEIIVCDLGLIARACCQPGGDFMAGGIAKALELLRGGREMWSAEQAAEFLEALIRPDDRHDALSVFAREDCVRVMNIHKAKGLEAPVVFLADPYGAYKHDVVRHIDRSEDKVLGYLGILGEGNAYGRRGSLLAHPHGWGELAEREARFLEAEELRLRYVAATRSGNATIISQKATRNGNNPWKCFDAGTPSRWEPPQACEKPVAESPKHLDLAALRNATEDIELRLARCARPTYGAHAAKEYALARSALSSQPVQESLLLEEPQAEGRPGRDRELPRERGQAFGEAVHAVIEAAMKKADLELEKEVAARLAAKGIRLEYAPGAVAMLEEVIASSLWKRAVSSPKRLVEAPFFVMLEDEKRPTLLRGVIDLAFQEEGGWVLVDYKTDRVEGKSIKALADDYRPQMELYARAWEKCGGETVKELLVYFLDVGKVVKIR